MQLLQLSPTLLYHCLICSVHRRPYLPGYVRGGSPDISNIPLSFQPFSLSVFLWYSSLVQGISSLPSLPLWPLPM